MTTSGFTRMLRLVALIAVALIAAGCGGGDGTGDGTEGGQSTTASPPLPEASGDGTVVAALGDSITAGTPLWDPDPAVREQLGPALDERSQYQFWAAKKKPALEFRNCGISGERTDEIAERLDGCAEGADVLIVQGGINDIAQGRPIEEILEDLRRMVQRGKELRLDVLIAEVLPWNGGYPEADPQIRELNGMIAQLAADESVPVLPFFSTLEDPKAPGRMKGELTDDGSHPSIAGHRRLGERAVAPFIFPRG